MKMKCKKIRGIDKNICTCEQKIAYNYAFAWVNTYERRIKELTNQADKCIVFQHIVDFITKDIMTRDDMKQYNPDAIITAFRNGFINYYNNYFIATNYEKIGEVFSIPYEII